MSILIAAMNSNQKLVLCLLVLVVILFAMGYRIQCGSKEGLQRRLANPYSIQDNAYASKQFPSYPSPVDYTIEEQREDYANLRDCQAMCSDVMGNTVHANCIQNCVMATVAPGSSDKACMSGDDCGPQGTCVQPSYYGGGQVGYCLDDNDREHFTYAPSHVSPLGRQTCYPGQFYNEYVDRCEPRFQGSSSPQAIMASEPEPSPKVMWPGTITPGYGVGETDPYDLPVKISGHPVKLMTQQQYSQLH